MKCVRLALFLLASILMLQPGSAQEHLAMVTKLTGKATAQGQELHLLSYLSRGDTAAISGNSELVVSYVKGGLRASAVGPCEIKFTDAGPVLVAGKKEQLTTQRPAKRVGTALPSNLDLGEGGHLRRGELALHLSSKLLPGPLELNFSALPAFQTFHLTISNASDFTEVFEAERKKGESFKLPGGTLKAGQSYDFMLQATSESGSTLEFEQTAVVLSQDLANRLGELAGPETDNDYPGLTELLVMYLQHGLDQQALETVGKLLRSDGEQPRLSEIQSTLRRRLQFGH